jgi:hypothetical protein
MATVVKWSGVTVAVQSALGTAKDIASITEASPAVVSTDYGSPTPAGHGFSNGDYVVLDVLGMNEVDGRVFRVAGVTTHTFQLESEDSSSYNTFVSGSVQKITFGNTVTTLTGLSASGGDYDFIDTTTIHETVRTQIPGPAAPGVYSFESFWDPADTGLRALKAASDVQGLRACHFAWPNGYRLLFNGYIGASLIPIGSAQDKTTTNVTVTMFGRPTTYTS